MPLIRLPQFYALTERSARFVLGNAATRGPLIRMPEGTPWYRYVSYRTNIPQVESAGRTQFLPLADDVNNRWTGSDLRGGGRQGLYFSADFLNVNNPFPEVSHYQRTGGPDSSSMVLHYEYTPGATPSVAAKPQAVKATSLRSMFLFTTTAEKCGLDLRFQPNGLDHNPVLKAVHERMRADGEWDAVKQEVAGQIDAENLEALYSDGEHADFCRAVGNVALEQLDVDYVTVTSVRDMESTNIVARTPVNANGDRVVLDFLMPQGRATFFATEDGLVGRGTFTVSDMLYNTSVEPPGQPPRGLPSVQEFVDKLTDFQYQAVDALTGELEVALKNGPAATPAMDEAVTQLTTLRAAIDTGDVAVVEASIDDARAAVEKARTDHGMPEAFKAVLDLSSNVTDSLSTMNRSIEDARAREAGEDVPPPEEIADPDVELVDARGVVE